MRRKMIAIAVAAILGGSSAFVMAQTPATAGKGMHSGAQTSSAHNGGSADGLPYNTIETTPDGIKYVSGGIGVEAQERLNARTDDFNLKLVFTLEQGNYIADVGVTVKDAQGKVLSQGTKQFGLPYDKILRGPIPDPFIKGGNTRKVPFSQAIPAGATPATVEAVLSYALIPTPDVALRDKYLATLKTDKERDAAKKILDDYTQPRVLTYRAKTL